MLVIFLLSLPLVDVAVGAPCGGVDAPPGFSLRVVWKGRGGKGRGGGSEVPVQLDTYIGEGVATYVTRYTLHTEHA